MKVAGLLACQVLFVAVGLFVYDALRGEQVPAPVLTEAAQGGGGGTFDGIGARPAEGGAKLLQQDGGQAGLVRRNAARLDTLEQLVAALRKRGGGGAGAGADGSAQPLELGDPSDLQGAGAVFDEKTLRSFEAYLDEINRRKMEARKKVGIRNEFARLGVQLPDAQMEDVVAATLEYQQKAQKLRGQPVAADEQARADRRAAYGSLKDEYVARLQKLVPAAEAEKITSSRFVRGLAFAADGGLGRARPFGGGGRRGGRRGGGR
jgi:hypothetical protein